MVPNVLKTASPLAWLLGACLLAGTSQAWAQDRRPKQEPRRSLKLVSYNVLYGFNHRKSQKQIAAWLAREQPDVVALQELNGFDHRGLRAVAAKWKHKHAAILKKKGFPVGLTSNRPITIVTRRLKGMHHGWMHCRTQELNFIVVHLSPFSYEHRLREAASICERVEALRADGEPVVVLGDFNAYSPLDKKQLRRTPGLLERCRAAEARKERIRNLREGKLDYSVMQTFLRAGLKDSCEAQVKRAKSRYGTAPTRLSGRSAAQQEEQLTRIDYVLLSESLASLVTHTAMPHDDEVLNQASDHIPVVVTLGLPARAPVRLRVLSYNVHHGEGTDGKLDLARIARVVKKASPDLVALQEVDQDTERSGGVDQPRRLGELTKMHVAFGGNLAFQGGRYGNVVLSRFPILAKRNEALPNHDRGEPRGALRVTIDHPRLEKLYFVATHFDHRRAPESRLASVELLNRLAKRWKRPTILAGDFNATPGSREIRDLIGSWATATPVALPTVPVKRPTKQLDYVFYRRPSEWRVHEVRVLDERVAADHRPVLAVLEARPK